MYDIFGYMVYDTKRYCLIVVILTDSILYFISIIVNRCIHIGFGGIRTHDILTPFKDWLRARRSAWLSYEPSETIHQLEIFKSKLLIGTDLTSLSFLSPLLIRTEAKSFIHSFIQGYTDGNGQSSIKYNYSSSIYSL